MANAIRTYFGDGSEFGVRMVYATESTPWARPDRCATPWMSSTSGSWSSPVTCSPTSTWPRWWLPRASGGLATLALKAVDNPLEFGIVITRDDGSIERFLEKPTWGQVFSDTINTGSTCSNPRSSTSSPRTAVDFSGESSLRRSPPQPLYGYVANGYWRTSDARGLHKSHQDILDHRVHVDVNGFQLRPGVWLGKGAEIDPSVVIEARP